MNINSARQELYQYALIINGLEQQEEIIPIYEKRSFQSLKENFTKSVNILVKTPGTNPIDNYLFFTANRDSYTKEENLLIEKQLLSELNTYFNNLKLKNLN